MTVGAWRDPATEAQHETHPLLLLGRYRSHHPAAGVRHGRLRPDLPAGTSCRYTCASIAVCTAEGAWIDGGLQCPECNAPDTPIATPAGDRPIASLAPGDLVYSIHHGEVAVVPIAEAGRRPQRDHHAVRLARATGAVLEISPRPPLR